MTTLLARWSANALVMGLSVLSIGCVPYGDGYGYSGAVYGVDYYQPSYYGTYGYGTYGQPYYGSYPVNYGGWGYGYQVAPYRGGVYHPVPSASRTSPPPYRPAAATRPVPSIPSRPRSGDGGPHDGDKRGDGHDRNKHN